MISITVKTPNAAWESCLIELFNHNKKTDNDYFYRDELAILEILEPCIEPAPKEFPMPQQEIDIINNYIITGENEMSVMHEWTKLYYHRIHDEPNSQYTYLLDKLAQPKLSGRALISLWNKSLDQDGDIAPCTQIRGCTPKLQNLPFKYASWIAK
jgi:thymidylate synthase